MSKLRGLGICCAVTFGLIAAVLVGFSFFSHNALHSVLLSQAKESVLLTSATYDQWGKIPGSTNTFVYKNFSFFNFTNPEAFAYFNQSAKFIETPSLDYQEFQNFLNANYTKKNSKGEPTVVEYFYQLYNLPVNTTNDKVNRTIVNLGPMGVWYSIRTITDDFIGINAFYQLQDGMVSSLYASILAQGILGQNMPDQATCNDQILSKLSEELSPDQMNAIWSDPLYGMGNQNTFPIWTQAALEGPLSGAANLLRDYFQLSVSQISQILGNPMQTWITMLNGILKNWWNCPTNPCDPHYLAALQWSQQGVTMNPPDTGGNSSSNATKPTPSITSSNNTAVGFPEISYFLKDYLLKNNFTGNVTKYENLSNFTIELGLQVLNGTPTPPYQYCATNQSLLNLRNYRFVLDTGMQWEQNGGSLDNLTGLAPIQSRWNLESLEHAYVFYKYCDYFVHEFALVYSMKGTKGYVGLGTIASQAMYQNFIALQKVLFVDYLARAINVNITIDQIGCKELMNNSFAGVSDTVLNATCSIPQLQNYDLESIKFLVTACRYEQGDAYQTLMNSAGLTKQDMMGLCQNTDAKTFGLYFASNQALLNQFYKCSNISDTCSDFEFAAKQWGSSNITASLPPILQNQFPTNSTLTVADFYPTIFPKAWEYLPVLKYLSPNFPDEPLTPLNYTRCQQLLNFLSMFSATILQRAYLFDLTGRLQNFTQLLGFENPVPILTYLRYLVLEFGLQGLSQTRTGNALLWGYRDPFLEQVANTSVLMGGDPSTQPDINLAGQNSSVEDAMKYYQQAVYTGAGDPAKVKTFAELQYLPYINFNNTYFDGLEVKQEFTTPWAENIPLAGSDSSLNPQGLTENSSICVYVNDLYFAGNSTWSGDVLELHGLKTWKYGINNKTISNKTNNPENAKYYFDRYNGAINISATKRLPLFMTKQYFLDADWSLVSAVELYNDTNMTQRIWPSRDKDLAIYVEPTTGAALKAEQRLQANVFFDQDELFPNIKPSMLPLFYIFRGYEFPEKTVNDLFGPLKIGLFLMNNGIYIFLGVGLFLLALALICGFCCCKPKEEKEERSWFEEHPEADKVENDDDSKSSALLSHNANNSSTHQI